MQARMKHPVFLLPDALQALRALDKVTHREGLPETTRQLVHLRASQINGCSVCVTLHAEELKKLGESDRRIFTVAAWRETPWFTAPERAALALTEAMTRIAVARTRFPMRSGRGRHATTAKRTSRRILTIAQINVWNRLNGAVRQIAGATWS